MDLPPGVICFATLRARSGGIVVVGPEGLAAVVLIVKRAGRFAI